MRRAPVKTQERDQLGFPLCLVCQKRVAKGRRSYCSDECWLRNTPTMIRRTVERRDNGICAGCGCQCQTSAVLRELRCGQQPARNWREVWQKLPNWQADHIIPVIEGGGLCGLDGYRTLCTNCHAKETAALARRRAAKRREERIQSASGKVIDRRETEEAKNAE